jgi:hypothetical protein
MDHASYSSFATTDQLQMAGLVLGALESGRMQMNARDYLDIASAATCELALMDTAELEQLPRRMPPALDDLIENVLFQRKHVDLYRDWRRRETRGTGESRFGTSAGPSGGPFAR